MSPAGQRGHAGLDDVYGELAANQPVSQVTVAGAGPAWLVTGYDEVRRVTDPRFSRHEVPDDILTAIVGPERAALPGGPG